MPRFGVSDALIASDLQELLNDLNAGKSISAETRHSVLRDDFADFLRFSLDRKVQSTPHYWQNAGIDIDRVKRNFPKLESVGRLIERDPNEARAIVRQLIEAWVPKS